MAENHAGASARRVPLAVSPFAFAVPKCPDHQVYSRLRERPLTNMTPRVLMYGCGLVLKMNCSGAWARHPIQVKS